MKIMKAIKGDLPKKKDIPNWSQEKLYAFVRFVSFFVEGDKFNVKRDRIQAAEIRADSEEYWNEFLSRIDVPGSSAKINAFSLKLMSTTRTVLSWLKDNPHAVTEDMERVMNETKRMSWALYPMRDKVTKMGGEIITLDTREETDPQLANRTPGNAPRTPEAQFHNSLKKMTSLLENLVGSVNTKDLKNINVEKKIKLITTLTSTLQKQMSGKNPNAVIFKQLNIHQASKEDLENAFVDYGKSQ